MTPHRRLAIMLWFCGWIVPAAYAQEPAPPVESATLGQSTTVHGYVRSGGGSPVPRALVRINGDAATGVLTDGEGHFEIPDVPVGPQEFTVVKPGFLDSLEDGADSAAWNAHGFGHNVMVAREMGDVVFTMQPVNSIVGQIQLSTGEVADGIQVTLLRRTVQDGRAVWQVASTSKTNSEGLYRFGDLTDGQYAVFTQPTMEDEGAPDLVEQASSKNMPRQGFASSFYPEARNLTDAAKIRLAGGDRAQANMTLTLEAFQPVTATVTLPGRRYSEEVSIQVLDAQGYQLPYSAHYDSATHTAQAALPDGTYSLVATLMLNRPMQVNTSDGERLHFSVRNPAPVSGQVSFAVAGGPVTNLRLPMSAAASTPIQVTLAHGDSAPQSTEPKVIITLTDAGAGIPGGITSAFAEGKISELVQTTHPPPGAYWVHTSIANNTVCEASFQAGAVSLAREPLVINETRSTGGQLILALRDDCAKLTLTLPGSVAMTAGIERFFTVYVVPDFDSTVDIVPQTLRLSTGGRVTIGGLTPGNYHVYTFDRPLSLEYRNPAVLREYPSQALTLAPNADAQLIVEVAQP